jgi:TonB-dependent SusC/RagA subfamily outer membrane receptor
VTGDDKILVISFTGYSTTEITIGDKTSINISLAVLSENLEDVIVVGYGTQKRSNVTGAVTALVTKDLVKSSEQDLNNQLTGRAPGIRIVQNSSQPGQFDSQIDIRGFSTESTTDYNGTETGGPLFVIDGVPRDQQTFQMLDPNEIASVSVLKDATASIYGVEAANGVILVTTNILPNIQAFLMLINMQHYMMKIKLTRH